MRRMRTLCFGVTVLHMEKPVQINYHSVIIILIEENIHLSNNCLYHNSVVAGKSLTLTKMLGTPLSISGSNRDKQLFTTMGILKQSVDLTCTSCAVGGHQCIKKKIHPGLERTCKLHTERGQVATRFEHTTSLL